jgi:ankyrin repeat protein
MPESIAATAKTETEQRDAFMASLVITPDALLALASAIGGPRDARGIIPGWTLDQLREFIRRHAVRLPEFLGVAEGDENTDLKEALRIDEAAMLGRLDYLAQFRIAAANGAFLLWTKGNPPHYRATERVRRVIASARYHPFGLTVLREKIGFASTYQAQVTLIGSEEKHAGFEAWDRVLNDCCHSDDIDALNVLIQAGIDVTLYANIDPAFVACAVEQGAEQCLGALLSAGVLNSPTVNGPALVHRAIKNHNSAIVQLLLAHGVPGTAMIEFPCIPDEQGFPWRLANDGCVSFASHAAAVEHCMTLCVLHSRGISLSTPDHKGRLPIHFAAICNRPASITYLSSFCNVNTPDHEGRAPLHHAAMANNDNAIEALLRASADVSVVDADGKTPLHVAAATGAVDAVRRLLKGGANPQAFDKQGNRPSPTALTPKCSEIEALLKAAVEKQSNNSP